MNNESQICFISSPHDSFFCGKVVEFKERYHKSQMNIIKHFFTAWVLTVIRDEILKISMIGKQTVLSRNV